MANNILSNKKDQNIVNIKFRKNSNLFATEEAPRWLRVPGRITVPTVALAVGTLSYYLFFSLLLFFLNMLRAGHTSSSRGSIIMALSSRLHSCLYISAKAQKYYKQKNYHHITETSKIWRQTKITRREK